MKIFLTGGTGFVGSKVLDELLERGHEVKLLARHPSTSKVEEKKGVQVVTGNVLDKQVVQKGTKGCDAVINLVGIIREFPQDGVTFDRLHVEATFNCVNAAQKNNVKKFVQMSALGTKKNAETKYHRTKYQAELLVKNSTINYTIVRPSVIFGEGDKSINMLLEQVNEGIVPLIGGGNQRWQPIHVEDVASVMCDALEKKELENETVELGGPEVYEYREIADLYANIINKKILKVPIPKWLMKLPTKAFQYQQWYPLSWGMLKMMEKDNVVEGKNIDEVLKIELKSFKKYLEEKIK